MTTSGESLNSWADDVSRLAGQFASDFEAAFGCPPGDNRVVMAPGAGRTRLAAELADAGVPAELCRLYSVIEEVSLPDLENGVFIASPGNVLSGIAGHQPTQVTGAVGAQVIVFGSDGGGGLFALTCPDGRVLLLRTGALVAQTYDATAGGVEACSQTLWGFLDDIRSNLASAVRENPCGPLGDDNA